MSKFRVGDVVRVTNSGKSYLKYEAFINKHAPEHRANWKCDRSIGKGTVGTVVVSAPHSWMDGNVLCVIKTRNGEVYMVAEDGLTLEPIMQNKIVITSDGKTTLAQLYEGDKVVRTAQANCAPTDGFVFETGAKMSFNRLIFGTDYNPDDAKIKPNALKVGDRVLVRNTKSGCMGAEGQKGTITARPNKSGFMESESGVNVLLDDGRVWRVNCDAIHPIEYWSGRAVCVDNKGYDQYWTVGKVYKFMDGSTTSNEGWSTPRYESLAQANGDVSGVSPHIGVKFIEFKG